MIFVDSPHGPGVIGLSCGELARYTEFHACFDAVQAPPGSIKAYGVGYDTASNSNDIIRQMRPGDQWVWLMDDDHAFDGDVLLRLLDRQVDLVVPFYLQRKPPFRPVVYTARADGKFDHLQFGDLQGQTGLVKIDSAGKGGVLIRRAVIEAMGEGPWFEHRGWIGEDHVFFTKAKELGFQLYVDLDVPLEHITPFKVRPVCEDGEWAGQVHLYNDVRVTVRQVGEA